MRVQSPKPARNGGWVHTLDNAPPWVPPYKPGTAPTINADAIWRQYHQETNADARKDLAKRLGVSVPSLEALGAAWAKAHAAWAFPMCDGNGRVVGIRLRADDGRKWAVRGSRQGIFIPSMPPKEVVFICEGPTDTAAGLALGLFALGRPSCNCGGEQLKLACRRLGVRRAVVVADNDRPGLQGAERVAHEIGLPSVTICPPCKDLREFLRLGGTEKLVQSMVNQQLWRTYGR